MTWWSGCLVMLTVVFAGRFAEAADAPTGYAQSELRRRSEDTPIELRNRRYTPDDYRPYATDEFGRAIVAPARPLTTLHGPNGAPLPAVPTADGSYYFGFDGQPIDDPFRLGEDEGLLSESGYYGPNGQPLEYDAVGAEGLTVYGSNGQPLDPNVLDGVSHGDALGVAAGKYSAGNVNGGAKSLGGGGVFRRDRRVPSGNVATSGTPVVQMPEIETPDPIEEAGTTESTDAAETPLRRSYRALLAKYESNEDDTSLSPLLPLINYDDDELWIDSNDDDTLPTKHAGSDGKGATQATSGRRAPLAMPHLESVPPRQLHGVTNPFATGAAGPKPLQQGAGRAKSPGLWPSPAAVGATRPSPFHSSVPSHAPFSSR
ncbi:MAG: hypothetical protein R3C10_14335 [Pirellulales bacterium]